MVSTSRRRALATCGALLVPTLSGCSDGGVENPAERGPLSIGEFAFAASEPSGYGEYEPQPDATYRRGDSLWVYVELNGLAARRVDGGVEIDLAERRILEHDGQELSTAEKTYRETIQSNQLQNFYARAGLPISDGSGSSQGFPTGESTLTVEYTDNVSGTSATESGTFTVTE